MANTDRQINWEEWDDERLRLAVQEILQSPNLRFFMRNLLGGLGVHSTPDGVNAYETARMIGRHSAGMDIVATLTTYNPLAFAALLEEDVTEGLQRNDKDKTYVD